LDVVRHSLFFADAACTLLPYWLVPNAESCRTRLAFRGKGLCFYPLRAAFSVISRASLRKLAFFTRFCFFATL